MSDVITNPNRAELEREADDLVGSRKGPFLHLHRVARADNHDAVVDQLTSHLQTRVVEIDAKILEGRGRHAQLKHYRNLREFMTSPSVRSRVRKSFSLHKLQEVNTRLQESNASYAFQLGLYPDEVTAASGTQFPLQDTFLPALNSPYAKQQTFHDYMSAHVKCFEAATRNPIGKRIVKLVPQFVLARGLTCDVPEASHQKAWNDFWDRHDMPIRIKVWLRELMTYGEQFNRHFKRGGKLVQRQIDPCTIWDVVTSPEDLEDIKYYYQQYVATSPITIPGASQPPSTLVIRHIPADEVDHYTINKTSSEKRGRSELYAVLGWLVRLKEFMNDRVLANKMRAMFALDVSVDGGPTDVAAANEQFAEPLGSGAVAVHNKAIVIEYKNVDTGAAEAETDASMLMKIIAIGAGVSEQFLGVGAAQTRASALLQTEPDVKNFEDYQQVVERMLHKTYRRMVDIEGLKSTTKIFEVSFPALAAEDRSAKLKDLALMEAQSWISKERAATMAAREADISGYDYDSEIKTIDRELGEELLVAQGFQSVQKVAPDPMEMAKLAAETQTANATIAADTKVKTSPMAMNAKNDDGRKVVSTAGQMGYSAKGKSGRNLANTSATLDRGTFTRGGERSSIKGRKSAGGPLRASAVWGAAARERSLQTRREGKLARLRETLRTVSPDSRRAETLRTDIAVLEQALGQSKPPSSE